MRILVAEDDKSLANILKKTLEKEGYAVDLLSEGETIERRLEISHGDYDIVILDLGLPGRDGLSICREARAHGVKLPILVLSAQADAAIKIAALEAGADDYLTKPFAIQELLARLRALLRRPPTIQIDELTVGDLKLNRLTRMVTRQDRPITLTVKEFTLLEYLMRHPNQIISRHQIIDELWGYDFVSGSNIVDVHIKNLRKKISAGKQKILETVRGLGYRLLDRTGQLKE